MKLFHFNGMFSLPIAGTVTDDYGTEHEFEDMIVNDGPLLVSRQMMDSAWRFEAEGLDEYAPVARHVANLFYPSMWSWIHGDYTVRVELRGRGAQS